VWLGGFLVLGLIGAGVASAAVLLWEYVDIRQIAPRLAEAPPPPPVPEFPRPGTHLDRTFRAALMVSPRNRAFFPDGDWYDASLDRWEATARDAGAEVRRIAPADISGMAPDEVLLVPEAPCLSVPEMNRIRRHLSRGGGVVANWAFGARDGQCTWRGWQAVQELTQAPDVREVEAREALYLSVPSGLALSPGLAPGARMELRGEPAVAVVDTGARAYWSDWALNSAPDASGGGADGAAVTVRTASGGRVAWFGFRLNQAATPGDDHALRTLVQNGLLWAAGVPIAAVSPWPDGRRAAILPVIEVEAQPRNALPIAALLQQEGIPGTFFAVTQLVFEDPELGQALLAAGEVGTQTTDHVPLRGRTAQDQQLTLRRSVAEARGWTGVEPEGLRPPEETFDQLTLQAWAAVGGRYLVGLNEARGAAPEVHVAGGDTVVVLPRLVKDDYNVFVQDRAVRADRLAEGYRAGLDRLLRLGGLAVLSGHTQILESEGRREAFMEVLRDARASDHWWFATGREVSDWWRARETTQLRWIQEPGEEESLLTLEVAAAGDRTVDQSVWVDLVLPGGTQGMEPWIDDEPVPFELTGVGMRVPVGALLPGEVRLLSLRPST
jgi:peptidoglycan/xylan/chitin deacetylase (PgdA/CDA1 family)